MDKGKKKNKNTQPQPLSAKNESEKQDLASAANASNPVESQPDFPSLQSSVPPTTGETPPRETLEKKTRHLKISESVTQKHEQQKPEPQTGTKSKSFAYSGAERIGHKLNKFPIYTVSSCEQKVGTSGRGIELKANHFKMKVSVPGGKIHHYDVEFIFSEKVVVKRLNRKLLMEAINLLKKKNSEIFANPYAVVFDGLKNIYTCKELSFGLKFEDEIEIKEYADALKVPQIKVILKYAGPVDVNYAVEEYCRRGTTETKPKDAIQALNIVLSMTPRLHYETIGRNHFNPNAKDGTAIDIGGGASLWVGTFTSVRLGWKPMLNVDVANKTGVDEGSVAEFVAKVLRSNKNYSPSHILLNEKRHRDDVDMKIKGLKVRYSRPDGYKRDYRAIRMMPAPSQLKMEQENGEECTIEKYFNDRYSYQLKFPDYPCIHVGNPEKKIYLPIELCMMKKQFLPLSKHLDDNQHQNMIRAAAKIPEERRKIIEKNLMRLSKNYDSDPFANAFGLKVNGEMLKIVGRVLKPPALKYKNVNEFQKINNGVWLAGRQEKDALKFLQPMNLNNWGVLDLGNLPDRAKQQFVKRLYAEGKLRGMPVDFPVYDKANAENMSQVKVAFRNLYDRGCTKLIMVINAKKGAARDELKYIGDTILRVPTQFVMKNNILGKGNSGPNDQVLHNICLKINHKLGGVNHALAKRPPIMSRPVMVMGADVTHPAPGDVSKKPSIAAVVGSADPNVSQFNVEIRLQDKGRVVEQIEQMEKITRSLLLKFNQKTQKKPEQIIYYRDGVSEGQFPAVLNHELSSIRRACMSLERNYEPKVTFIIAQKRHKTRFFVENPNDGVGRTKNIPAGTVVDKQITTLSEIDFFLASHEGIQVISLQFSFFFFFFSYFLQERLECSS